MIVVTASERLRRSDELEYAVSLQLWRAVQELYRDRANHLRAVYKAA